MLLYYMDNSVLIILIASASGLCALFAKLCYSSRCSHIKACGVDIVRDTIHEQVISIGPTQSDRENNNI